RGGRALRGSEGAAPQRHHRLHRHRRAAGRVARLALAGSRRRQPRPGRAHHPHGAGHQRGRSAGSLRVRRQGQRQTGAREGATMTETSRTVAAIALALAALAAPPANGRTLDRRAAVRAALAQNPQIAAARAEEAVLRAQRRQVDAAGWPIVSIEGGVGPSLKATLVPGTAAQSVESQYHDLGLSDLSATFLGNLTVIQPLYTFGKIATRQEAAAHGLRAR